MLIQDQLDGLFVLEENMKNKVTQKQIDNIIKHSRIDVKTVFDKVTLVTCKLPNGFVLVESSGAVDKSNYDVEIGKETCMTRITNKIWELEGYSLANQLIKKVN